MIVVLHAGTPGRWGLPLHDYPFIYGVTILAQIGVPMFFFISGLLFYRTCSFKDIERKLNSRVYSLFIPYILWNAFFVCVYFILAHVPFVHEKMNMGNVLNDFAEIMDAIVNSRYTPLWFVKDLMVFCLLSAGIFIALKNKMIAFLTLFVLIIIALLKEYDNENILLWFPMYFSGAIVGKFYVKEQQLTNNIYRGVLVGFLLILFGILYYFSWSNPDKLFYFRFFSPIIVWFLTDFLLQNFLSVKFQVRKWMSYMFFIYCTHYFLLNILQKIIVLTCSPSPIVLNMTFIITPIVVIPMLILCARFLSKYKFYFYLSGGR